MLLLDVFKTEYVEDFLLTFRVKIRSKNKHNFNVLI